jgi:hypothetical protein
MVGEITERMLHYRLFCMAGEIKTCIFIGYYCALKSVSIQKIDR